MMISEHDLQLILHPELRDPEQERRRLDTLARVEQLERQLNGRSAAGGVTVRLKSKANILR